jgi:Rubisco LSMT substrate-binding
MINCCNTMGLWKKTIPMMCTLCHPCDRGILQHSNRHSVGRLLLVDWKSWTERVCWVPAKQWALQTMKLKVDDSLSAANINGGVVINRVQGLDPAVLQAWRALDSTDAEWDAAGQAIGNFCLENSGGVENEQRARLVARTAIALELSSKATTIQQDQELLRRLESSKGLDASPSERLAIQFRIEKKKLLQEAIEMLK